MSHIDEYETIHSAANRLGLDPQTVRAWIRKGRVQGYRIGERKICVRIADIDAQVTPIVPDDLDAQRDELRELADEHRVLGGPLTAVPAAE